MSISAGILMVSLLMIQYCILYIWKRRRCRSTKRNPERRSFHIGSMHCNVSVCKCNMYQPNNHKKNWRGNMKSVNRFLWVFVAWHHNVSGEMRQSHGINKLHYMFLTLQSSKQIWLPIKWWIKTVCCVNEMRF